MVCPRLLSYLFNECLHGKGCWNTDAEREAFAKGGWRAYYNEACKGNDQYACRAGEVAEQKGVLATITTVRLETSLINNGVVQSRYQAGFLTEEMRNELAAAYIKHLDDLHATAAAPQAPDRLVIRDFHELIFESKGASPGAFGGRITDGINRMLGFKIYDYCPNCRN